VTEDTMRELNARLSAAGYNSADLEQDPDAQVVAVVLKRDIIGEQIGVLLHGFGLAVIRGLRRGSASPLPRLAVGERRAQATNVRRPLLPVQVPSIVGQRPGHRPDIRQEPRSEGRALGHRVEGSPSFPPPTLPLWARLVPQKENGGRTDP
jgi:hypothetical protein